MFTPFSQYDYTNFPVVKLKLTSYIKNDEEFNEFTKHWIKLYNNKKDFLFIIDTRNMELCSVKYCILMGLFLRSLKSRNPHYLKQSIIIIKNNIVRQMLSVIFLIEKPIATVYLTYSEPQNYTLLNPYISQNDLNNLIKIENIYKPI